MKDLAISLPNRPGALADMGDVLGRAGVSIEGGGAFVVDARGIAHFLVDDAATASAALKASGIRVLEEREVLVQRLNQQQPGQLGKISRRMAEAGVNIEVLYSDHDHQLILVVDNIAKGRVVSEAWAREAEQTGAAVKQHTYNIRMEWVGNDGEGTKSYRSYRRDYNITVAGKPTVAGSSDPAFRGDPARYNPEELLVASLSSCHMLWYLHLCAVNHVTVLDYRDEASGVMRENEDGSGEFTRVLLRPVVKIAPGNDQAKAFSLHAEAHHLCFIARSVNFDVEVEPRIQGQ